MKIVLSVFFDCNGAVYYEFLTKGARSTQKRSELWKYQSWTLHHDNTSAYTSMLLRRLLAENKTILMSQPPYSTDFASVADFLIFPKLKTAMKGKRYATIEQIKAKSTQELLAIPKRTFQKCFVDFKISQKI